ncbi:VOC family protein [Novosphingobium album (ex Hu et al. 2023)]|uniref:VOC family protein n=1 Tax=Novosphingobium album (ex Hu et al. 2023) TaxID=2930093 RepID=A0ABT0AZ37_9SPHN|nr:VOC family protein [Novosphingobium album (ex Hu et al. 2023)]MCJ2178047.1 VOC family protein [Novosphingobium album (ex Hu et al. 2023)]
MPDLPIRQIAYFVPDIREAARAHAQAFGSGPYYVADNIPLKRALYRGTEGHLDHSSAYGQWGEVMIEFCQQNNPGPSAFHDLYPEGSGRTGLHHVALFVDDVAMAAEAWRTQGHAIALDATMTDGFRYVFVDTVEKYGHMLELYEPLPALTGFYELVRASAGDMSEGVLRTITFG